IIQDPSQLLHVKVNSGIIPIDIFCTFSYAKCYRNPRRILWEELVKLSNQGVPWIVGGDFNVILYPNENQGGDMQRLGPMDDFNDMMSDTGLIDAGFEGEPFTWTNKRVWRNSTESFILRNGLKHLTSLEFCTYLEDCQTTTLSALKRLKLKIRSRRHSDSKICGCTTTPFSIRSNNLGNFQLRDMACTSYNKKSTEQRSCLRNGIGKHLERLHYFNRPKQEATDVKKKFDRDPSEANLIALNKSNAVMVHTLTLEVEYWKQKSNCKWLEAGERNTKYFHSLVKKKRVKFTIHRIMEGSQEITSPDRIRDSTASYFENLLSGQVTQSSATDFPFQFSKILEAIGNNLCLIPTEEDIKEIVFSIDKESVAGPNGFSSAF
ncbi:UNVERIFIED_CONTAM: hypothetical protein Slati_0208000, partial [Sesamum latifolium]